MPERRLEFYLNSKGKKVKVFSLGGPATGQDQQLLSLKEYYQKYRADMVILWFTAANDVWNNTFPANDARTPKPTFWLKDGQLAGPTEATGQPMRETPRLKLTQLWRRVFTYSRDKDWAEFLPSPYTPMTSYDGPIREEWQKRLEASPLYLRYENFDTDKNDRALYFTPRSPRIQYGLDLTRKLFRFKRNPRASKAGTPFKGVPPTLLRHQGNSKGEHIPFLFFCSKSSIHSIKSTIRFPDAELLIEIDSARRHRLRVLPPTLF
jgi:hypothetical protein